jgi:hypothetical protein
VICAEKLGQQRNNRRPGHACDGPVRYDKRLLELGGGPGTGSKNPAWRRQFHARGVPQFVCLPSPGSVA